MYYVVTNSDVYHHTETDSVESAALCGFSYDALSASVVTQEPADGFRLCERCKAVTDGSG